METDVTVGGAADGETQKVESSAMSAGDVSETANTPKTMAIEVMLPTIIAAHVKTILTRRGVALDDLILDLLTRFVPGALEIALHSPEIDIAVPLSIEEGIEA